MSGETKMLPMAPDAIAPDGSEVRVLCASGRGSMAHFTLPAGAVSQAVAHRTIEELWFFVGGTGEMWRRAGTEEALVAVGPGVSISIPAGTSFQFRADAGAPLCAVGVSMPPWPGMDEAYAVAGCWPATVGTKGS